MGTELKFLRRFRKLIESLVGQLGGRRTTPEGVQGYRGDTLDSDAVCAKRPLRPGAEDVEIIPDDRVEILDPTSEKPSSREYRVGQIDVMAVITKALTSAGLMKPPR